MKTASAPRRSFWCNIIAYQKLFTLLSVCAWIPIDAQTQTDASQPDGVVVVVEGELTSLYHQSDEWKIHDTKKYRFWVNLDGPEWRYDDLTSRPRHVYYDGETIFERNFVRGREVQNSCSVSLPDKNGYPVESYAWDQGVLWAAHAAREHYRNIERTNGITVSPTGTPRSDAWVAAMRIQCDWGDERYPLCPEQIAYNFDRSYAKKESPSYYKLQREGDYLTDRSERFDRAIEKYTNGHQFALLSVSEWIASENVSVPAHWEMTQFNADSAPQKIYRARLHEAYRTNAIPNYDFPQVADVIDYRVRDVARGLNYIGYSATNGVIPDLNSTFIQGKAQRRADPGELRPLPPSRFERFKRDAGPWLRNLFLSN